MLEKVILNSLFLTLLSLGLFGQSPLQEGFTYLETGQFSKAEVFFGNYLEDVDSTNKTALLCYGRGVGLSGKPNKAIGIFQDMLTTYEGDFEIELNYAEAHMWGKQYPKALFLYLDLAEKEPDNFAAQLGLANAYSENKQYQNALNQIAVALALQPTNANALTSRKYIRLGFAAKLANDSEFDRAIELLKEILEENPKDIDGLVVISQVLTTAERYEEARLYYHLLKKIPEKQVMALIGLARLENLQKSPEDAYQWTEKAMTVASEDEKLVATLGQVDAHGWNKKFKKAFNLLENLQSEYAGKKELLSAMGRINIWSKHFGKGASFYKQLLQMDSSSFDGNMGYADARHAQGLDKESFKYVRNTLQHHQQQRDALQFLERLHVGHDPSLSPSIFFSRDNGGNISQNYRLKATFDPTAQWRTELLYHRRTVRNLISNEGQSPSISVDQIGLGTHVRLNALLKLGAEAALFNNNNSQQFLLGLNSWWTLGRFQTLELKYNQEVQTFNGDLIERNLQMANITANYNLSLPFNVGLYSQLIHTNISDGNTRNLMFASLYYNLKTSPIIKAGFNLSLFSFKEQVPEVYFSPDIFKGYELFVAAENVNEPKAKFIYQSIVAAGYQQISSEGLQSIYRFDIKAGYKFNPRSRFMVYFMRSNSAASSVQGFTYNEWGITGNFIIPYRGI